MRQIMQSSLDYAGFAQLCGRSPIMGEIMRAHNRIIPRSLLICMHLCTHRQTSQNRSAIYRIGRSKKCDTKLRNYNLICLLTTLHHQQVDKNCTQTL